MLPPGHCQHKQKNISVNHQIHLPLQSKISYNENVRVRFAPSPPGDAYWGSLEQRCIIFACPHEQWDDDSPDRGYRSDALCSGC